AGLKALSSPTRSDYRIVARKVVGRSGVDLDELLVLSALGRLGVHVIAVARGLLPGLRSHRPLGLARQPMDFLGRQHGAFGEDLLLLGRERLGASCGPGCVAVASAQPLEALGLAA